MGAKKIITLFIAVVIIIVIAILIIIFMKRTFEKTSFQDLRTNLLLIQAKAKTYTENVNVETANLDTEKEEDSTKIAEVKDQKLKGTVLESCDDSIKNAAKQVGIEDWTDFYYLTQEDLNDMEININVEKDTYYLVKYNFEDTEVVYTKGYEYKGITYYKLSEMKNIEKKKTKNFIKCQGLK